MDKNTVKALLYVLVPDIEKERAAHPTGYSHTFTVASKIGSTLAAVTKDFNLDEWDEAIGNKPWE